MTEFSKAMETFDLISDRNLADTSSFFVIVAAWNVARLDGRRIFRSYRYPAREFHLPGALLSVCSFFDDPVETGAVGTNDGVMKDEKTMKSGQWRGFLSADSIPTPTYTSTRVKEPKSSRFSLPFLPLHHPLSFSSSSSSILGISFVTSSGCTRQRHSPLVVVDPSDKTGCGTLDNGIIDRHVQSTTRVIAPFDELAVNRNTH